MSDTALTSDRAIEFEANGLPNTFVPGRNLLFLGFAATIAYRRGASVLVGGMCETDFSGYPDCRDNTLKAMQVALSLGLATPLTIETPLMFLDQGADLGAHRLAGRRGAQRLIVEKTHTCYLGERGSGTTGATAAACARPASCAPPATPASSPRPPRPAGMTSHWLFQLVLLAVLLAWVVGAYNRLVRLRTAIISAWEQIVAALVKRSEAMAAVADAVREPLAAEAARCRRWPTPTRSSAPPPTACARRAPASRTSRCGSAPRPAWRRPPAACAR